MTFIFIRNSSKNYLKSKKMNPEIRSLKDHQAPLSQNKFFKKRYLDICLCIGILGQVFTQYFRQKKLRIYFSSPPFDPHNPTISRFKKGLSLENVICVSQPKSIGKNYRNTTLHLPSGRKTMQSSPEGSLRMPNPKGVHSTVFQFYCVLELAMTILKMCLVNRLIELLKFYELDEWGGRGRGV